MVNSSLIWEMNRLLTVHWRSHMQLGIWHTCNYGVKDRKEGLALFPGPPFLFSVRVRGEPGNGAKHMDTLRPGQFGDCFLQACRGNLYAVNSQYVQKVGVSITTPHVHVGGCVRHCPARTCGWVCLSFWFAYHVIYKLYTTFCVQIKLSLDYTYYGVSLVPRPFLAPVFDRLQYAKTEEGLVNLTTWSAAQASHVVTLICIAMLGRSLILSSVLATKTRQTLTENNINRTKHIWARRNSSKVLPIDMCKISAVTKFS